MRSRAAHIALAAAVVTIGVAATAAASGAPVAVQSVAKTTIPGTTPSTSAAVAPAPAGVPTTAVATTVPAGFVMVIDDTRRIQVAVPAAWTDRQTAPQMADDGSDRPKISASPDIAAMNTGWATPGVWFGVVPAPGDPAAWLAAYSFTNQCSRGPSEPFTNGTFTGTRDTWVNCGGGSTQIVQVGARTPDGSVGVFVQIQALGPDDPTLAPVLASLGIVPGAALGPSQQPVNSSTVSTIGPADPSMVAPAVPADAVRVVDDTGRLAMSVPPSFADTSTASGVNDDATPRPALSAAPDRAAYSSRWDAAGIEAVVLPAIDLATLLANREQPCTDGGIRPFSNGRLSGLAQTWNGCGGTSTTVVQLALTPADRSVAILVYAQLPDADLTALQLAVATIELR